MTSSQPVATPNALNFTPDNKRCYAYSGDVAVSASNTTMLEFSTNSEYIVATFEYHGTIAQIASNQLAIELTLNGVSIIHTYYDATVDHTLWDYPPKIIIPPFTDFKITLAQASGSDRTMQVTLTGEVFGMTEVGYQ